jgi:acyl-CoA thioesterase
MVIRELLEAITSEDGVLKGNIPDDWLQGRTAYGGLSAAMALHAAQQSEPDLPPLRSAQVSFVGPLAGPVTIETELLRRGRTAAFINADVRSEKGLGTRGTFVFMEGRESSIDHVKPDFPDVPPPDVEHALARRLKINFLQNFDFVDLKDQPGQGPADYLRWIRIRDREDLDPMVELIAIADALPPAAMNLVDGFGPISSLTWIANILTETPETEDGWWLIRSRSDYARHGSSSQVMGVWNTRGEQVVAGMQGVALFL